MPSYARTAVAIVAAALVAVTAGSLPQPASQADALARVIEVGNSEELDSALTSARAGDQIVLADGEYEIGSMSGRHGTAAEPIVVRAEHRGRANITEGQLEIEDSSYVTFEGLTWTNSDTLKVTSSNNVRLTRNHFRLTEEESLKWVIIQGANSHHNRIDHNLFEEKNQLGNFITIDGSETQQSQYDRIDHNHFRDIGPRAENEMEAIRVGWSEISESSGHTTVEQNLFENCDGDPEIVSVKSNDNIVRYNTFRTSQGTLTQRHGNRGQLYGNFFLGGGKAGTGGIRLYGQDHKVYNNYFEGLTGTGYDAALQLDGGDVDTSGALSSHFRVYRATVVHNTFVNNVSNIEIGANYKHPPADSIVANNVVAGSQGKLFNELKQPVNHTYAGNLAWPTGSATVGVDGIEVKDPLLAKENELYRIGDGSPAIDAGAGTYDFLADDMDGQARAGRADVGADERSTAEVTRRPLTAADVGPEAPETPEAPGVPGAPEAPNPVPSAGHHTLRVSDNGRFLVKPDGTPFYYLADTAWELFHRQNREDADTYLEDRAAKGFTVIQAVALAELDGVGTPNAYGHLPLDNRDPASPRVVDGPGNDYWDQVDYIVDKAESLGMYMGFLPTWGRWVNNDRIFDAGNAFEYGKFLGARYQDKPIIWILGGDRPADTSERKEIWRAMARGIAVGVNGTEDYSNVLMTYHSWAETSSSDWFGNDEEWLDFHAIQSGAKRWNNPCLYECPAHDYALEPAKPTVDIEVNYDDSVVNWDPDQCCYTDYDVRKGSYWSVFAGGFGITYGTRNIWQFWTPDRDPVSYPQKYWYDSLDLPGAFHVAIQKDLMLSRPFLTRVPAQELLRSDPGREGSRVQATKNADGAFAFVYIPNEDQSVSVDLSQISGDTVSAWWFNPRDGKVYAQDGNVTTSPFGQFPSTGTREFTTPSSGPDWVLVLDDVSKGFGAPGAARQAADDTKYGTDGQGNPRTDDCTVSTTSNPQAVVDDASDGDVVCVKPGDYSRSTLTIDKPVTVRANGVVKLKNIVLEGSGATVDGFTVVGDELDDPSTGIKFSGSGHQIVNNLVNGKHIHYAIACDPDDCASDVLISGNSVTQTNNFGVYLWGGSDITVEWNNIYDLWSDDGNDDVDGMRVWGTGHVIRNNYIHDLNVNKGEGEPHADCLQTYQHSSRTDVAYDITVENNYCTRVSGQCLIMQNEHRPTADVRGFTYRGNVCESFGGQNIELGSVTGSIIENNILCGGVDGHVLTFHSTVDDLETTDVKLRNNILVTAGGSIYARGSRDALTDDTDNVELTDPSIADDWREFEDNPDAPVPAINPADFTEFRARAQQVDVIDQGSPPHSPNFTTDVDGASRVRGAAIDIGPFEF
jgi:Protein of unknown function (DUF4038)/Chondroitinase B/Putative collagen-binding domain of a collagenase/Right handed beta helix region